VNDRQVALAAKFEAVSHGAEWLRRALSGRSEPVAGRGLSRKLGIDCS